MTKPDGVPFILNHTERILMIPHRSQLAALLVLSLTGAAGQAQTAQEPVSLCASMREADVATVKPWQLQPGNLQVYIVFPGGNRSEAQTTRLPSRRDFLPAIA